MQIFTKNRLTFIKAFLVLSILLLFNQVVMAQSGYTEFADKSLVTQNIGMYTLGGWAIANIATGAYGWAHSSDDRMYFNQMNLMWNVFNLSIAGFALYSNSQIDFASMSADGVLNSHIKTERILLINSALDLGYIGTGFLLNYFSKSSNKNQHILRGYGNSLILQGGFLLVFDLVLYQILKTQRLDFVSGLSAFNTPEAIGLSMSFNF
ncbi:MAG: DUF6992 family protein [Bacteroidales bacterium]